MTATERAQMREEMRMQERKQLVLDAVGCFGGFAVIIAFFFVVAL